MNEEKQIEEMAMVICTNCVVGQTRCKFYTKPCDVVRQECEVLYNAGYRKQSEGEWISTGDKEERYDTLYRCSICGDYSFGGNYCSFCGAKMKGGEE